MSANKENSRDYQTLGSSSKSDGDQTLDGSTLKPSNLKKSDKDDITSDKNLRNLNNKEDVDDPSFGLKLKKADPNTAEERVLKEKLNEQIEKKPETVKEEELDHYALKSKLRREKKRLERDKKLLSGDNWLVRNGHYLTFIGLYCFSILVLFRPYELVPGLGFLSATAIYAAIATLFVYLPTQLSAEGNLTTLSTEVKAVVVMTIVALISIPIAKDPGLAWKTFDEIFIKAVLMFIVMVNVLRNRKRLMAMMWLSLGIGVVLSYIALGMYMRGELNAEGYRVTVDIGGLFGNPNDIALHLATMFPIAIALGLASKNLAIRFGYFFVALILVSATMITYSRGGFLGMLVASAILVWKLGRKYRLNVTIASIFVGALVTLLAPGNYALRMLSIFGIVPDPVGSRGQRSELLWRSLHVSARNPWGIGIGNFEIVGVRGLGTHNAYTQVSSELGIIGLMAYIVFVVSPFRKLGAIERTVFNNNETGWFYYLAIGLQASLAAYMVSSFFAHVAYNWYIYYLIAYAVAFRRIYQIEKGLKEELKPKPLTENLLGWQIKST